MENYTYTTIKSAIYDCAQLGRTVATADIGRMSLDALKTAENELIDAVSRYLSALQRANVLGADLLDIEKIDGAAKMYADVEISRNEIFDALRTLKSISLMDYKLTIHDPELLAQRLTTVKAYKNSAGEVISRTLEMKAFPTCRREIEYYLFQKDYSKAEETVEEVESRKAKAKARKQTLKAMQKKFGGYVDENAPDMPHDVFVAIWERCLLCGDPADVYASATCYAMEWRDEQAKKSIEQARAQAKSGKGDNHVA